MIDFAEIPIDFANPYTWLVLMIIFVFMMVASTNTDSLMFLCFFLAIASMLMMFVTMGINESNIQEQALTDYQNNNVSLIKYSENIAYRDKVYELYQTELEINESAGFWCRFNMNG